MRDLLSLLSGLAADYSRPVLRAAVIRSWAVSNGVDLENVKSGRVASSFLCVESAADVEKVSTQIQQRCGTVSLKEVERSFEHFIDEEHRTKQGAVYTPDYIIDYLIEHGLKEGWTNRSALPRICDPACGSAGFLVRAAEHLERQGIEPAVAFGTCLVGVDNDEWAIKHAEALIELYLAAHQVTLPGPKPRLLCQDSLLTDANELRHKMGVPKGFDAVVTNPPYVKLQNLDPEYRSALADAYSEFVKGSFGLAPLFLIAGLRLASDDGCAAMITQNNLFTSLAGGNVRDFLQEGRHMRRIVDFGHQKVFQNASAYTCLIFLSHRETDGFAFESLSDAAVDREALATSTFSTIPYDQLDAKKWRLAKGRHFDHLLAIESTGVPMGDMADIKVGFATLKDAVFFAWKENGHCIAETSNGDTHPIESEATRPAVKIADIETQSDLSQNARRIIFPYRKQGETYQLIPEDRFRTAFPSTYDYLQTHREKLAGRDKGRKRYKGWYAWGRTQGREADGPKLLTKTFNSEPRFFLDESDQLFCNGYAITLKEQSLFGSPLPLEALQRILNSTLMHYYAKLTSFQIEGNYQCYQKNFIERFGIASLTQVQIDELLLLPENEVDCYVCDLYSIPFDDVESVVRR